MDQPSFSPDLPITSAKDDRLNRSAFATALASALRNWNQKSSLVVALYGDWGSGKSSVKNMVLESLRDGIEPKEQLKVVEFNPWQLNNQEILSRAFFDEIGNALGQHHLGEAEEEAEQRSAKWKTYSTYLNLGSSITKSLKVILPLVGVPIVGDALDTALQGLEQSATLAKEGAEGIEASGKATGTLQHLKKLVSDSLTKLPRPILVVLDDVDRLAHDEIRLMFQLIKANADFPNLIYLVLAQRSTVVNALEPIAPGQGDAFLEKIVQVGFSVPRIDRRQLEQLLFAGLDTFIADEHVGKRFDQERWAKLYQAGFMHFFGNLRDVNRYLSSLGFHIGVFRSGTSFEVNPVDLIGLEVLRVFAPTVYDGLAGAKHIFTDEPRFMRKEEKAQDAEFLNKLIAAASDEDREQVSDILRFLSPPAKDVLAGSYYSGRGGDNWFADLRVCSHDAFDRYFHFATPPGDISQAELDELMGMIGDRAALGKKFKELEKRSLLEPALDRLDSYKETFALEHAETFITALYDLDVEGRDDFLSVRFSPQTHVQRIIHWYLKREPDQGRRKQIMLNAIRETDGLYTPVNSVSWLQTKLTRENIPDPDALLVDLADIKALQKAAVTKIRKASTSDRLQRDREFAFLLYRWRQWTDGKQVSKWIQAFSKSESGLLRLLSVLRGTTTIHSGPIPKKEHYYKLEDVEWLVPLSKLSKKVANVDYSRLGADDAANIVLFKTALAERKP